MSVQFYDVKAKKKVSIEEGNIKKTKFEKKTKNGSLQVRYAFQATHDGRKLYKFVSKGDWDKLNAPLA